MVAASRSPSPAARGRARGHGAADAVAIRTRRVLVSRAREWTASTRRSRHHRATRTTPRLATGTRWQATRSRAPHAADLGTPGVPAPHTGRSNLADRADSPRPNRPPTARPPEAVARPTARADPRLRAQSGRATCRRGTRTPRRLLRWTNSSRGRTAMQSMRRRRRAHRRRTRRCRRLRSTAIRPGRPAAEAIRQGPAGSDWSRCVRCVDPSARMRRHARPRTGASAGECRGPSFPPISPARVPRS